MEILEKLTKKTSGKLRLFADVLLASMEEIQKSLDYKKVARKKNGEVAYQADVQVERIIVHELRQQGFEGSVLAEEGGTYGSGTEKILLDPLDGSTNAVLGFPLFAILLAYSTGAHLSDVEGALVFAPSLYRVYWGEKGKGAYLTTLEGTYALSTERRKHETELIDVVPENTDPKDIVTCTSYAGKYRHVGSLGLALSFTAEGILEGVVNIANRAKIVDVAGPFRLLQEAGGSYLTDFDIIDDPTKRLCFIAARNSQIKEDLMRLVWENRVIE